jgi:hypothetical protein
MRVAALIVAASLAALPAQALTDEHRRVVMVAGIMNAAEKWCTGYIIDMKMVARGVAGLKINMEDPDAQRVFVEAFNKFESGLMQYGATQLCKDVYALTRETASKGLGVLMVPK